MLVAGKGLKGSTKTAERYEKNQSRSRSREREANLKYIKN